MKKSWTDEELAELAQWAEENERAVINPTLTGQAVGFSQLAQDKKKAYGAIRQGIDWLLRTRIIEHAQNVAGAGKPALVPERKQ
jgi:hypothetical protein